MKFKHLATIVILAVFVLTIACSPTETREIADLVVHNGSIYTMDETLPLANAVAVRDAEILFVGSSENALNYVGEETRVIDM